MTLPDRVAFTIFGRDIYWYAIMLAIGIVVATIVASIEAKRKKMHPDTVIDICLWAIPLGVIGARLYYVLFELEKYLAKPISMLYIWEGGLAIPGAIIGGALGIFIYSRIKKKRFLRFADIIAPGLVLAQAIGRWGNFFNQEAFGKAVELTFPLPWWFRFPFIVRIDEVMGGVVVGSSYHMATFFYESAACVLIFAILWSIRKRVKHDGDLVITYGILYGLVRTIIEGFRTDSLMLGGIRITQLLSFVLAVSILIFLVVRRIREEKLGVIIWPKHIEYLDESKPGVEKEDKTDVEHEISTPAEILAEDKDLAEFGISPELILNENEEKTDVVAEDVENENDENDENGENEED